MKQGYNKYMLYIINVTMKTIIYIIKCTRIMKKKCPTHTLLSFCLDLILVPCDIKERVNTRIIYFIHEIYLFVCLIDCFRYHQKFSYVSITLDPLSLDFCTSHHII